jgi:hypothetical protein
MFNLKIKFMKTTREVIFKQYDVFCHLLDEMRKEKISYYVRHEKSNRHKSVIRYFFRKK